MLVSELIGGETITCGPDATVHEAARLMVQNEAGSIAVVSDGDLVGIVTERDLVRLMAGDLDLTEHVGSVMTPSPDSLARDVEVSYAADWMLAAGYRHLPVLDDGRLVGIVSIKDVLWAVTQGRTI